MPRASPPRRHARHGAARSGTRGDRFRTKKREALPARILLRRAGMQRPTTFAVGLAAAASLLLRVATGCSTSNPSNPGAGSPDAGEDSTGTDNGFDSGACTAAGGQCVVGSVSCAVPGPQSCGPAGPGGTFCCLSQSVDDGGPAPHPCNAGCLCYAIDACPTGCYPSVTEAPDGSGSEPFCSNGIVQCVAGGFSWSSGTPGNNCPAGPTAYLDGGPAPDGSFCCDYQQEDAGVDAAAADAGASDAAADAHAE
jgi:hypothetical protein